MLDACLDALETAHEKDELVVSPKLGLRLQQHLPSIEPGMLIADAIELVFQEQEALTDGKTAYQIAVQPGGVSDQQLLEAGGEGSGHGEPFGLMPRKLDSDGSISIAEARSLTERIRTATRMVCLLLLDAYERRVWFALGYRNWEEYVRCALGFRRSRSYELLDQARTIRALQAAARTSAVPDISAFAAELIKPYLGEVLESVRTRAQSLSSDQANEVIADVVQQRLRVIKPGRTLQRLAREAERQVGSVAAGKTEAMGAQLPPNLGPAEVRQLLDAIDYLAELPAIERQSAVDQDDIDPDELDRAVRWLVEFEAVCKTWPTGGLAIASYPSPPVA